MMAGHEQQSGDPTTDLLVRRAFPDLASAVRTGTEAIVVAWEAAILRVLPDDKGLSETQLRDHLPQVLALLADVLAEDNPAEARRLLESPLQHGVARFDQNYDTGRFISEYRLLRRAVVERSEGALGRRLSTEEDLALDMAIDGMLQRGVVVFVEHQGARLRSATEAEKKYLSFLSHDLRNNLNAVVLDLEVLKRRLRASPEFAEEVNDLGATQHSILETVAGMDRLLQAERLRKRADPKLAPVDLHALARDVAHHYGTGAAKKGVNLAVDVAAGTVIHSDREWIALVLQNLVGNAVKYSARGTVRVGSTRETGPHGARWVLAVSDEGPGIAPEMLARVFEAFGRGDTHGEPGLGLGLAVASEAAKRLGGELTVRSEVGAGSTFCLVLPDRGEG